MTKEPRPPETNLEPAVAGTATAAPARIPVPADAVLSAVLRQLASAVSAYRLYAGDVRQPAFVQAATRVHETTSRALEGADLIDLEIRRGRFFGPSGPLPPDDMVERLGQACFDRGVERLWIRSAPDGDDLAVLGRALSLTPSEVADQGGMRALVAGAGLVSIGLGEVEFKGAEDPSPAIATTASELEARSVLGDATSLAEAMMAAAAGRTNDRGTVVFRKIQSLVTELSPADRDDASVYWRIQVAMERLDPDLRRAVIATLIDRVMENPIAERLIGTMTDAELARVLAELGPSEGTNPVEAAGQLVRAGARHTGLLDLVAALLAGKEDAGTIVPGLPAGSDGQGHGAPEPRTIVAETVSDLMASGLLSEEQDDVRTIREEFPASPEDERAVAMLALRDYFREERDPERIGRVLEAWVEQARAALRARDHELLSQLLSAVRAAEGDGSRAHPRRTAVVEGYRRMVLSPQVLADMVSVEAADVDVVGSLLAPFGEVAVQGLLDLLVEEEDRSRRGVLVSLLAHLAPGNLEAVASRLSDGRWYVARNAVTVLYRSESADALPFLTHAASHREPAVRREVVRGLVALGGIDPAPALEELAEDEDETVRAAAVSALGRLVAPDALAELARPGKGYRGSKDQRDALQELAGRPHAAPILRYLSSKKATPRLPRGLRRQARSLAAGAGRTPPATGGTA
jgi:hypothetical protein